MFLVDTFTLFLLPGRLLQLHFLEYFFSGEMSLVPASRAIQKITHPGRSKTPTLHSSPSSPGLLPTTAMSLGNCLPCTILLHFFSFSFPCRPRRRSRPSPCSSSMCIHSILASGNWCRKASSARMNDECHTLSHYQGYSMHPTSPF